MDDELAPPPKVRVVDGAAQALAGRHGSGVGRPDAYTEDPPQVERSFGFIDVCGFTALTEREGPASACAKLEAFRGVVRRVTARRGVRVARWLGDGAMLVGVEGPPLAATLVEICGRFYSLALDVRAGFSCGSALLFDGDDYLGRTVNVAARLCSAAGPGEVFAETGIAVPDWISQSPHRVVDVSGVGPVEITVLLPDAKVRYPLLSPPPLS